MNNVDAEPRFGQQELSLQELWRIALRRRKIVIAAAGSVVMLPLLYSFLATPKYTATGQLLIDREPNILSFEQIFQIESFNDDYFQTQFKLLQSRALAARTRTGRRRAGDRPRPNPPSGSRRMRRDSAGGRSIPCSPT